MPTAWWSTSSTISWAPASQTASAPATLAQASAKAWRYVAEMEEIAATQQAAGLSPDLFRALSVVYADLADAAPWRPCRRDVRAGSRWRTCSAGSPRQPETEPARQARHETRDRVGSAPGVLSAASRRTSARCG